MDGCVVVVEDEIDLLQLVRDVLEMQGMSVRSTSDPRQIESVVKSVRPELFLINVMLPGMSGIDLARKLRGNGFATIPMIAMSASKSMAVMARESGQFQEAIDKPFDIDELLDAVKRHLGARV